jgi:hypothetical protein
MTITKAFKTYKGEVVCFNCGRGEEDAQYPTGECDECSGFEDAKTFPSPIICTNCGFENERCMMCDIEFNNMEGR